MTGMTEEKIDYLEVRWRAGAPEGVACQRIKMSARAQSKAGGEGASKENSDGADQITLF